MSGHSADSRRKWKTYFVSVLFGAGQLMSGCLLLLEKDFNENGESEPRQ